MPDVGQYQFFSGGPSPHYQHPAQWASPRPEEHVGHLWPVPSGWLRHDEGVWSHYRPEGSVLPDAGGKLHVSTTPDSYPAVFLRVADVCATHGVPFKAGLIGLGRSLARETARAGVRVNVVAPGLIDTDMAETLPTDVLAQTVEATPLRRLGTPDEAASVIAFLLSDASSYMTGAVVAVDGGLSMGL